MSAQQAPTMLLEIKVISANDLPPLARLLRTYVVACLDHEDRSHTAVDREGGTNPTWNHKFSFYVDDRFLNSKSSEIKFEIYNVAWLRDLPMGTTSLVFSTISPPLSPKNPTVRPFALRIRRPSGHLQGILNVGVQLKDNLLIHPPESTIGCQKPPAWLESNADKVPLTLELQNYNGSDEFGEHQNMPKECKASETASFLESITTAYEDKSLLSCVTEQSNTTRLRSARSSGMHRVTSSETAVVDFWGGDNVEDDNCLTGNSIFESWIRAAAGDESREGETKNMKKESIPATGKDKAGSRRGGRKHCLHRRCESEGGRPRSISFSAKLKLICGISFMDRKKRSSRRHSKKVADDCTCG